ncbi:transposase [Victivallis sp. Marseille-Q1083]|uniref:transposase n=1 Tax=Victivallis sp. Marseille-Q1083 TaxID=2717288 RepID=UPI00158A4C8B|nr:transposase [Victivallis sp. Marseille-Q1083]
MENVAPIDEKVLSNAFKIDEKEIKNHLASMVKESVEETLNELLNTEVDAICGIGRYERSHDRQDIRAGSYSCKLTTGVGEVSLQVPRLCSLPFETQIIERYKYRESSIEGTLVEMYLAGVLVRRIEDITEAL